MDLPPPAMVPLPQGWAVHMSATYKRPFYFHAATGTRQWEPPVAPAPAPAPAPATLQEPGAAAAAHTLATVRAHYNARRDAAAVARSTSVTLLTRQLNNWLKAAAFHAFGPVDGGFSVLDVACGKGGDLHKWQHLGAAAYMGIDIASGSIDDARVRAAGSVLPAQFAVGDMTLPNFGTWTSRPSYDVVSCQFALHYAFGSDATAATALRNLAAACAPHGRIIAIVPDAAEIMRRAGASAAATAGDQGGARPPLASFGNTLYRVDMGAGSRGLGRHSAPRTGAAYDFTLRDCVDRCTEFVVCPQALAAAATGANLSLHVSMNLAEFAAYCGKVPPYPPPTVDVDKYARNAACRAAAASVAEYDTLWRAMGLPPSAADVPREHWDVASLYRLVLLRPLAAGSVSVPRPPPPPPSCPCHNAT